MTESGTFERLSIFPECPIDFDDFPEQIRYSRNGRHVCHLLQASKRASLTGLDSGICFNRLIVHLNLFYITDLVSSMGLLTLQL